MDNPEETTYQDEITLQAEPKQRWPLFIGGLALIVVLGAAAFLAGRLMNRPGQNAGGPGGPNQMRLSVKGGPGGAKEFSLKLKPAPELPTTPAEVNGVFTQRQDNSLFVGTGNVGIKISAGQGGANATAESSYDGPVVEVVVTQNTKIYHDITQLDPDNPGAETQQVVELASIEDIGPNSTISAWGKKVGDRIVAEVLFFSQPFIMKALGGQ